MPAGPPTMQSTLRPMDNQAFVAPPPAPSNMSDHFGSINASRTGTTSAPVSVPTPPSSTSSLQPVDGTAAPLSPVPSSPSADTHRVNGDPLPGIPGSTPPAATPGATSPVASTDMGSPPPPSSWPMPPK